MVKQIIITVLIIAVIVGVGIIEIKSIEKSFKTLEDEITVAAQLALDDKLDEQTFDKCFEHWQTLREQLEYLINHLDTTEMDLRMAEVKASVKLQDKNEIYRQLIVLKELSIHIPHTIKPRLEHIL